MALVHDAVDSASGTCSLVTLSKVWRRIAMVSLAERGVEITAIAGLMDCSTQTVLRWIRRGRTSDKLHDLPRSGRPKRYSEEVRLRIVAFYCQTQPLPECSRWSLRWAARRLLVEPTKIGISPSKSTLHRVLQNNRLKPHRSRYFLHITDPDFFPKMEHLVTLYRNPPRHLFFFDECPGIQVLKRIAPDFQSDGLRQRLEEFEYIRNGTLDIFAFLHYADSKITLECHGDHTTETFVGVFRRHVARFQANEPLHYVMDNLSSHLSYPFCQIVAELSGVVCPPERTLKTQVERMIWLRDEDKRIVIHFTPFHGSWLNLVEIWFGIMGQKVLTESFASPDHLKAAFKAFVDDWNLLLAHPFRWSYDGKGLHAKAIKRFTAMLSISVSNMDLRTLTKQLNLTTNLLNDYFRQVPLPTWNHLAESFSSRYAEVNDLIHKEPSPRRKNKALCALFNLSAALYQHKLTVHGLVA